MARVTIAGRPTFGDYVALLTDIAAHPGFEPGLDIFVDISALELVMPSGEVRTLAAHLRDHEALRDCRWAVYSTSTVLYGMTRMIAALVDRPEIRAFRSPEEAVAWLAE